MLLFAVLKSFVYNKPFNNPKDGSYLELDLDTHEGKTGAILFLECDFLLSQ